MHHHRKNILKSESHLHLYGCIDAETLWHVTQDRAAKYPDRFQWFLSEYERATGVHVHPHQWWRDVNGFDTFKRHFICDHSVSFDVFQAKFNLLIALFPPNPNDLWLAKKVFETHAREGGFKEYRTFLPLYLPKPDRTSYLRRIIETARDFESDTYHPRIAVSLMRSDAEAWEGYRFLSEFLVTNPDCAPWITGIDFCASERGHPPSSKNKFFLQVLTDNKERKHPLQILYHVGEMWQDISIASAARWCTEAAQLGVHRLGHALALGMNCDVLDGRKILETSKEASDHLNWIRGHSSELHNYGFTPIDYKWLCETIQTNSHGDWVEWTYNAPLIEHTTKFQSALLQMVKSINPIVESCPTSNMRIGSLLSTDQHPLRRFLDQQLKLTVSTDDPGIFAVNLANEELNLIQNFGVDDDELRGMESRTRAIFEL